MRCYKLLLGLVLVCSASVVSAHDPGLSTAKVVVHQSSLDITLSFAPSDVNVLESTDPNQPPPDYVLDKAFTQDSLKQLGKALVTVTKDGRVAPLSSLAVDYDAKNNNITFRLQFDQRPRLIAQITFNQLKHLKPGHREYLSVALDGGPPILEKLLSIQDASIDIHIPMESAPSSDKPAISLAAFFKLGIEHILTGYDHLLFLFGLLLVCRGWKALVSIVTCFTVAHTLTLGAATMDLVHISKQIVDPAIILTIIYVGVENIVTKGEPHTRKGVTFVFGLIHGLGFATVLRELGVGQNGHELFVPLCGFNLGVEIGQIAVGSLLLGIIWWLRGFPRFMRRGVAIGSAVVALVGVYWLIDQLVT